MFCSKCINSHVEYGQATCPICFTALDKNSFQLSKFVTRQIGRLRIQCFYADNGCVWQGLFSDNHITEVIFFYGKKKKTREQCINYDFYIVCVV